MARISIDSRKKFVESTLPPGKILNDFDEDVDHLGHGVYAKALAQQIKNLNPPCTVGIFGRSGAGKSFLLKYVRSILKHNQETIKKYENTEFVIMVLSIIVAIFLLQISIASFFTPSISVIVGILLFFALILSIFLAAICSAKSIRTFYNYFKVVWYVLLTQLPIKENSFPYISTRLSTTYSIKQNCERRKKKQRFLFVNYNAWQYAGSDNLWVGLVANIDEKIEDEFGAFTTRMFRTFALDTVEKSPFNFTNLLIKFENDKINQCQTDEIKKKLKKLLGEKMNFKPLEEWESQYNYSVDISNKEKWWVVQCYYRKQAEEAHNRLQSYRDLKVSFLETPQSIISKNSFWKQIKSYPRMNYIFSMSTLLLLILASIALLIYSLIVNPATFTVAIVALVFNSLAAILKPLYGLYYSSNRRLRSAVKSAKGQGFFKTALINLMDESKKEVQSMIDLIHTVELTHNIEYKVVITIDNLDRLPLAKVKSMMEAVNILLSDRDSPFICLIAIDSRIANHCFIASEGIKDISPTANGYEYLKKIINLPFCLPEMNKLAQSSYTSGLIDEAEKKQLSGRHFQTSSAVNNRSSSFSNSQPSVVRNRTLSVASSPSSSAANNNRPSSVVNSRSSSVANINQRSSVASSPSSSVANINQPSSVVNSRSSSATSTQGPTNTTLGSLLDFESQFAFNFNEFVFKCRLLLHEDDELTKHLSGNPRNVKRIFNIISLTASFIYLTKKKQNQYFVKTKNDTSDEEDSNILEKEFLYWLVLTDQWPFRMSYILFLIDEADQREDKDMDDQVSLFEIYTTGFKPEKMAIDSFSSLIRMDDDSDVFRSLLLSCQDFLTKGKAKKLWKITINLDSNLINSIASEKSKNVLNTVTEKESQNKNLP